jgi:DNA polymerase-3 subunit beta
MEIKIDRDEFYKAISRVQSIIEKRSNIPILSMILLSTEGSDVHISATDLEISYQQRITAEVINPGSITISGRKLFEILKESKRSEISIKEKENHWVSIFDEDARFNLACLPADEYPSFVEPKDVVIVEMDGNILREMINNTIYSVAMEEAGFKLSGVFTEVVTQSGKAFLRMVSTDGHRLSKIDREVKDVEKLKMNGGVMIPKKGILEVNKLTSEGGPVEVGFIKNNCVVRRENILIVIRLLESQFPDYNAVIPKKTKYTVPLSRMSLLDGMKKMVILSNESYKGVKMSFSKDNLELVSINPDLGDAEENLKVPYNGEKLELGFNARYFIDVLQVMESETVELGITDNSSPCLIHGENDKGFLGLVMPMRL